MPLSAPRQDRILEFFSISGSELPTLRMVHMGDGAMKKYVYSGEMTAAGFVQFHDDYEAGTLTADLKSEDTPSDNTGPVKVVVGGHPLPQPPSPAPCCRRGGPPTTRGR